MDTRPIQFSPVATGHATNSSMGGGISFEEVFRSTCSGMPTLASSPRPTPRAALQEIARGADGATKPNTVLPPPKVEQAWEESNLPPGFSKAFHSFINQPGLTNVDKLNICAAVGLAFAAARGQLPPHLAARYSYSEFKNMHSSNFSSVDAIVAVADDLGSRYPHIAAIAHEWAASYRA